MSSFKTKLLNGFVWRLGLYVSSFVLNIFIAQQFGAENSGIFYLLLNNIAFIVLLLTLGIDSAVAYFTSRKEINSTRLLQVSVIWSIIILTILFAAYFSAIQLKLVSLNELMPYIILNVGSSIMANCLSSVLFSTEDNKTPNLVFTVMNLALIFLMPTMPWLKTVSGHDDYVKIYLSLTALPSLVFLIILMLRGSTFATKIPDSYIRKKFISFALKSFTYSLLYALLLRLDYWLVDHYCTYASLGNYLQATKFSQIILLVPTLASFALFPLIVSHIHEDKKIETKLLKLVSLYFYIGVAMCAGVTGIGYWLFPFLYGKSFTHLYSTFVLLSPGILALAAAYPLATFFSGKNSISTKIIALSFSILLLLVLDLLLIPAFDIAGAAIASSIAYSFYFFYLLFNFKKTHTFKLTDLLKIRPIVKDNLPKMITKKSPDEN